MFSQPTKVQACCFLGCSVLFAGSCNGTDVPLPYRSCSASADALSFEEAASNGLSGAEVVAEAQDRFADVQVTWDSGATPASESFSFAFGQPVATEERTQSGSCVERTWVSVAIPVEITSASGDVEASGVIELWGVDEGGLQVFAVWPHDEERLEATLSGPYLATAQAGGGSLQGTNLGLRAAFWDEDGPPHQDLSISADYLDGSTGIARVLYRCGGEGDFANTNCLTFAN